MGEVYRALDTKLRREVALKRLPAIADASGERLARFQHEARVIAGLNHPNIVTLYSVEESGGVPFLTMELVDGESLGKRVPRQGFALEELLRLAIPIADAVSFAHKQGITHRDLKPDNVMIDASGRVKVLDFGLAKLLDAVPETTDHTVALYQTQEGRILGTAAYMSPEQAEGKPVDARSDVFSLGIVLYEMATGRRPFEGETAISTISSIVKETPPSALEINRSLPRQLGRILDRCLAKDPERRYQSALELRNELELLDRDSKSGELERWVAPDESVPRARSSMRATAAWGIALVAIGVAAFLVGRTGAAKTDAPTVSIDFFERLTERDVAERDPSASPDGTLFVFTAQEGDAPDIFLQRRGGARAINLTADSPMGDHSPAFSPDGEWIAFASQREGGGIYVMGATGESVRRVAPGGSDPSWSPDGTQLVYSSTFVDTPGNRDDSGSLWVVPVKGGTPVRITPEDRDAVQPDWSPNGARIVFWSVARPNGQRDLWTCRPDGSDLRRLTDDVDLDWSPRFGPDGDRVYFASNRGGTMNLWTIAIDPDSGEARGTAQPVTLAITELGRFALARDGSEIFYTEITRSSQAYLLTLPDRPSRTAPLAQVTRGATFVQRPRLSPDGQWITFTNSSEQGWQDVFVARVDGSDVRRVTHDAYRDRGADWAPDGSHIVFYSDRSGAYEIWTIRPDGSDARRISDVGAQGIDAQWFPSYAPDGRRMTTLNDAGSHLYDVDPTTGMLVNMRELRPPDGPNFYAKEWDRSATRIVGWAGEKASRADGGIWIHDLRDASWQKISDARGGWTALAFAPDGQSVLAWEDGRILTIDLATHAVEVLVEEVDRIESFSLAADGRTALVNLRHHESDIWSARLRPSSAR